MIAAALALSLAATPAVPPPPSPAAPRDDRVDVLSAMIAELARSTERLKLGSYAFDSSAPEDGT
ncbi:MAG TPA: hypothetical protein VFK90_04260, partial [Anaeromyxobacter sp.]|nr:hypothetical protein [Anaeromyxobacter sp.]